MLSRKVFKISQAEWDLRNDQIISIVVEGFAILPYIENHNKEIILRGQRILLAS